MKYLILLLLVSGCANQTSYPNRAYYYQEQQERQAESERKNETQPAQNYPRYDAERARMEYEQNERSRQGYEKAFGTAIDAVSGANQPPKPKRVHCKTDTFNHTTDCEEQ
jgi:hypothetical protein